MHPAFSVIFLTTLIGVGQGLFIALNIGQVFDLARDDISLGHGFYAWGAFLVLSFLALGLIASVFHLGHPERAWRAVTQWRTSWLSREVIVLPLFMLIAFAYMLGHFDGIGAEQSLTLGLVGIIVCFTLFICTGMIYACLRFLREWATPLTVVNFILFGCASGFIFAAAYAGWGGHSALLNLFGEIGAWLTLGALISRGWTLKRNAELRAKPKTTTQTATGIHHPQVRQTSMGLMGGSYNTREFFHGMKEFAVRRIKSFFLVMVFPVTLALLLAGIALDSALLVSLAFLAQYIGLIAERWYFFAQVNHPQNIYYQRVG